MSNAGAPKKLMALTEFITLVHKMREAQINYFEKKCLTNLLDAKALESDVDDELVKYLEVMKPHSHTQAHTRTPTLF